jgi:hypothetical protein
MSFKTLSSDQYLQTLLAFAMVIQTQIHCSRLICGGKFQSIWLFMARVIDRQTYPSLCLTLYTSNKLCQSMMDK